MTSTRASRRQRADVRVIVPSVSAAAHCAQSCLRFWNLLLQDAASVNPFGLSADGYDRAEEEDEDEGQLYAPENDDENDPLAISNLLSEAEEQAKQQLKEEEEEENQRHALYGHGYSAPHPEAYMKPRSIHWWNHHVCFAREDDPCFAEIFRLPVGFFTVVCSLCRDDMRQGEIPPSLRHVEGRIMSVERQVAIAVMRLVTGNTFKMVSELLGCGRSTVVKIVNKFVDSLRHRASHYIQWPSTAEELVRVKDGFLNKHGLLNCCGALDSTFIVMDLPTGEPADVWLDRNRNFSMILQAVVDTELRFLDVCVGYPGSLNGAQSLRESSFYKKCASGQRLNGNSIRTGDSTVGEYVVGDLEYPLLPWLMRPYKENELTPPRAFYNEILSATRITVARVFGRLKGTFRMFSGTVKQPNLERMPKMIHACCIMHNMCVDAGGVEGVHFPESEVVVQFESDMLEGVNGEENDDAFQARENICSYLQALHTLTDSHKQGSDGL